MSAVRQFQPLMPFSVPAFAATLFALGLALGTTIAVGMLFFIQVSLLIIFTARCSFKLFKPFSEISVTAEYSFF